MPAKPKTDATGRARETFLRILEETCNVTEAARAAGFDRSTAYRWRDEDPAFAEAWKQAEEAAADKLEQVAFERAKGGQSDRMLEILLKGHRPKYREKQRLEHSGPDGGPMRFDLSGLSDEELDALEKLRSRIAVAGSDQGGEGQTAG
jgi:hypothetical protein